MKKITSILIVDDNESDHVIAEVAIDEYDSSIKIHKAYDGREALNLLADLESPPDIILLDINMPGMDGHDFLVEYAKTNQLSSVVAMLTTSDQESDRERCMAYSCVKEYIVKPLEASDIDIIAKAL